jgi:predicted permease
MPDWKPEIRAQLAALKLSLTRELEIVEEVAQHLQDRFDELVAGGASEQEARDLALQELQGDVLARGISRVERSLPPNPVVLGAGKASHLDNLWRDIGYGWRMLIKDRGFTAVAAATLALGIGANTSIFSVMNKFLLRPIPVEEPSQIVALNNGLTKGESMPIFSYANYRDLRDGSDVTTGLIAYETVPASLSSGAINDRVWGYLVSGNYFSVLGTRAVLGRLISVDDDSEAGAHPVAVISYPCWQRRFGGDQGVVGRDVLVNGRDFTIIGIAPPEFIGLELSYVPEIWFPLMMQSEFKPLMPGPAKGSRAWLEDRSVMSVFVAGRLRSGVTVTQAETALKKVAANLAKEYPRENDGMSICLSRPGVWGGFGRGWLLGFSGVLMGVAGLVLLLVCTNLANLLLARGVDRRKEIAVRLALGARRNRVVRQLLTETLLLSLPGGALGLVLAFGLVRLPARFTASLPLSLTVDIDWRVLSFSLTISFITSAVFGLLPALQSTRPDLVRGLKDETVFLGYRRSRLRGGLVVAQVALSLVLMISAGLVLRGLVRLQEADFGFNPRQAVKLSVDLDLQGYARERGQLFQQQILDRVRVLPEVEAAGVGNFIPPDPHVMTATIRIEGKPPPGPGETLRCGTASASPGYFEALGMRLVRGRDFLESDDEKSVRVAVINETFARRSWPGEDALGKRFTLSDRADAPIQVVGIVRDAKYRRLAEEPMSFAFLPLRQSYKGLTTLVVRTSGQEALVITASREAFHQLDPHLPVFDVRSLSQHVRSALLPALTAAAMLGGFGALSLVLAATGIFGVTSYSVSQRTHEIGVRMALGAERGDVLNLLLREGMALVLLGMLLGLAGAVALARLMSNLLSGVGATDVTTFAGISVALIVVSLFACWLPANRATRIDPMEALRYE